ncbi:MAG: UDP-N-acetylmuramoyl-L-alanyl-D-glutamate--2,6-diaminopimelate ligase [Polyangiaceae bacterium UTPRO1]|nr:MAG: UDP-N-acetylmuramoyl-L-alanyl-D-glutamate--2,6-diaminopimelate ligase [Polyangiaceae bacterium UTPRO1]
MTLAELLAGVDGVELELRGDGRVPIARLSADSRDVRPGDFFVALPGTRTDGGRFVDEACRGGAVAVAAVAATNVPAGIPLVVVAEPARFLARAAACFHGDPGSALTMVGVTGTNGKTTVTYLLEAIWRAAGARPGVMGTINYRFGDVAEAAPLTTPPAGEIFARLAAMRAGGATHVAMEVSSHALVQDRTFGMPWDAAIFTNLGRDHMDFHRDRDEYLRAKARLFTALDASPKPRKVAVLNAADASVAGLEPAIASPIVTFGTGGDVRAEDVRMTLDGITATLVVGGAEVAIATPLVGSGHLENVLAATAAAHALGTPLATIAGALARFDGVPGRLEPVVAGQDFTVLVDYAHTPDALAGVLGSLRALVPERLICVFGCGGDRDRGKRPLMGAVVGRHADVAVLTSDNPRTEDPLRILADAAPGLERSGLPLLANLGGGRRGYLVQPDRAQAIASALTIARAGDCVVIAGKGHEDYQIVGAEKRPFDDRAVARRVLAGRGTGARGARVRA